jgi:hypothetical protein
MEATKHGKGIRRNERKQHATCKCIKKIGGPGNTLRSILIIYSVSGRHIRKCGTLNGTAGDRLVRYLLSDCKACGLTVADVSESAFQFAIKNGVSHKFNLEKQTAGYH